MNTDVDDNDSLALVTKFFDALNGQDVEAMLATVHPDIVYRFHIAGFDDVSGREGMRESFAMIFQIFPDFHEDMLEVTIRDDLAVVHWRLTGSLNGPFPLGDVVVMPEQRQTNVAIYGVDVFKLSDGLIKQKDTFADPSPWRDAYASLPASKSR
jgi:steroid delta-isomerase-like uncharacterized protein